MSSRPKRSRRPTTQLYTALTASEEAELKKALKASLKETTHASASAAQGSTATETRTETKSTSDRSLSSSASLAPPTGVLPSQGRQQQPASRRPSSEVAARSDDQSAVGTPAASAPSHNTETEPFRAPVSSKRIKRKKGPKPVTQQYLVQEFRATADQVVDFLSLSPSRRRESWSEFWHHQGRGTYELPSVRRQRPGEPASSATQVVRSASTSSVAQAADASETRTHLSSANTPGSEASVFPSLTGTPSSAPTQSRISSRGPGDLESSASAVSATDISVPTPEHISRSTSPCIDDHASTMASASSLSGQAASTDSLASLPLPSKKPQRHAHQHTASATPPSTDASPAPSKAPLPSKRRMSAAHEDEASSIATSGLGHMLKRPKARAASSKRPTTSSASWNPEQQPSSSTLKGTVEAPTFYPTPEEFEDPMAYIASIRHIGEKYGICRIVPPEDWSPSCAIDERSFEFGTRLQRLHQLYRRKGPVTEFYDTLAEHLTTEGITLDSWPAMGGVEIDLYRLQGLVAENGGLQQVINRNRWRRIANKLGIPASAQKRVSRLQAMYYKYLLSFDMLSDDERKQVQRRAAARRQRKPTSDEPFGFGCGKKHTLQSFKKLADDFKAAYFGCKTGDDADSIPKSQIENVFWEVVDKGDRHVSVYYGSDIDSTQQGSGFSTSSTDSYSRHPWNLNVMPTLPGSVLRNSDGISGISMPWLYVGMVFSTFCWHVEDNFLYSINYHHFGAPKRWYGVPGSDAQAFERVFRQYLPDEFAKNPTLLHDIVTQLSPEKLTAEGVAVSTCCQEAGHFVITFPQAYHAGFSYGFNCGEAVNFGLPDWLPFGMAALKSYQQLHRPVSLDQEQLLCSTAKKESSETTLKYVLPLLREMRDSELEQRQALQQKGVLRHMTTDDLARFSPEFGRDPAMYMQSGSRMKTSAFAKLKEMTQTTAPPSSGTFGMRSAMRFAETLKSAHDELLPGQICCHVCQKICYLSTLLETEGESSEDASLFGSDVTINSTLCLKCGHELLDQGKLNAATLMLVTRLSIRELNQILDRAQALMQ